MLQTTTPTTVKTVEKSSKLPLVAAPPRHKQCIADKHVAHAGPMTLIEQATAYISQISSGS